MKSIGARLAAGLVTVVLGACAPGLGSPTAPTADSSASRPAPSPTRTDWVLKEGDPQPMVGCEPLAERLRDVGAAGGGLVRAVLTVDAQTRAGVDGLLQTRITLRDVSRVAGAAPPSSVWIKGGSVDGRVQTVYPSTGGSYWSADGAVLVLWWPGSSGGEAVTTALAGDRVFVGSQGCWRDPGFVQQGSYAAPVTTLPGTWVEAMTERTAVTLASVTSVAATAMR